MDLREIVITWIDKTDSLEEGESFAIPCENRWQQKYLTSLFFKELKLLQEIDPEFGSKIRVAPRFKDSNLWVILSKVPGDPFLGFKKDLSGEVTRVKLNKKEEKDG